MALFNNAANGFDRSRIDWFATVRGRLGYAFDRLLIYGTGGVAFADRQDRPTPCVGCAASGAGIASGQALVGTSFYVTPDAETAGGGVAPTAAAGFVNDNRGSDVGWTAGGGVEYAFTNNLTARIEGRFIQSLRRLRTRPGHGRLLPDGRQRGGRDEHRRTGVRRYVRRRVRPPLPAGRHRSRPRGPELQVQHALRETGAGAKRRLLPRRPGDVVAGGGRALVRTCDRAARAVGLGRAGHIGQSRLFPRAGHVGLL